MGAQQADQRDAVLPRQIPLEQHHVWQLRADPFERGLGIGHAARPVPGTVQIQPDQLLDGRLGFDDEDVCGHGRPLGKV
jgi:hypothetical protein